LANNSVSRTVKNFIARIVPNAILNIDDIIKIMRKRGTSATEPDIRHILILFFEVVCEEIKNGNFVNTPWVNARPGINGTFPSATDVFDKSRNMVKATLSQGTLLEQKMTEAISEKVVQPISSPIVLEFIDAKSKTSNSLASVGNIGTLVGDMMKFVEENTVEGVFFIDAAGNATRAEVYSDIYDTEVKFNIPVLPAGQYTIEVRRAYTKDNIIRKGVLKDLVTVA
jgi:hypothetical protein